MLWTLLYKKQLRIKWSWRNKNLSFLKSYPPVPSWLRRQNLSLVCAHILEHVGFKGMTTCIRVGVGNTVGGAPPSSPPPWSAAWWWPGPGRSRASVLEVGIAGMLIILNCSIQDAKINNQNIPFSLFNSSLKRGCTNNSYFHAQFCWSVMLFSQTSSGIKSDQKLF